MSDLAKPSAEELARFYAQAFPSGNQDRSPRFEIVEDDRVRLVLPFRERYLRPGGTISGPVLMGFADSVMYALVLRNLGLTAAPAATSNLTMAFLRRPAAADLVGEGRLLRLGRRLAVGDVTLCSTGDERPVAHAQVSYALPQAAS